ncbi:MAG: hypothetical protein ACTS44_01680 [Candidatus Hodgkinia cicadicola]
MFPRSLIKSQRLDIFTMLTVNRTVRSYERLKCITLPREQKMIS